MRRPFPKCASLVQLERLLAARRAAIGHPEHLKPVVQTPQQFLGRHAAKLRRGEFELFKTTSIFDSTATNPVWLGEEPQRVRDMMQA